MVTTTAPFTKTFPTIVQDFAAAAQAASAKPLDFSTGSGFLAIAEATGGNVDWLQKLYLFALSVERLATSFGPWVDTWTADYMPPVPGTTSPRLPATPATGPVTFSSATPQAQAVVPVGALIASFDGSQTFTVYADPTNTAYSSSIIPGGGYIRPAGVSSISVPVVALNAGIVGNIAANTITLIQSSIVGIDSVTNAAPFINALSAETDIQLKARFPLYIASLRQATPGAIGYAVISLAQGLQYTIHENVDPGGGADLGAFTVYIDDGSGSPPLATVQNASASINAARAAGVRASIVAATTLIANVVMTITTAPGYSHTLLVAAVQNAVGAFVNNLGLEVTLNYLELAHVAFNASPGITGVDNMTLNGGIADLVPAAGQTIKIGSNAVS